MLAYGLHWEAYLDGGQQRETKRTG
jgi:hypothetical protein